MGFSVPVISGLTDLIIAQSKNVNRNNDSEKIRNRDFDLNQEINSWKPIRLYKINPPANKIDKANKAPPNELGKIWRDANNQKRYEKMNKPTGRDKVIPRSGKNLKTL